jgi:dolichol kinase
VLVPVLVLVRALVLVLVLVQLVLLGVQRSSWDHPRDQPGKYLYYAGAFWLYLHSHCRLRNVTLVSVLCAYNGDLTMALV